MKLYHSLYSMILNLFLLIYLVERYVQNINNGYIIHLFYLVYILMEKEITTHSSILIRENPWIEKLGKLQSMRLHKVKHNLASKQ